MSVNYRYKLSMMDDNDDVAVISLFVHVGDDGREIVKIGEISERYILDNWDICYPIISNSVR